MPQRPLGHRVLAKVAPECFRDNMEPVFTTLLKTMSNPQTSREYHAWKKRHLNTQESQNKKEKKSQEFAFHFPQTSIKSLQCEAFLYTNGKLRAIFTASSPEPFCLPWRVFHGCFVSFAYAQV